MGGFFRARSGVWVLLCIVVSAGATQSAAFLGQDLDFNKCAESGDVHCAGLINSKLSSLKNAISALSHARHGQTLGPTSERRESVFLELGEGAPEAKGEGMPHKGAAFADNESLMAAVNSLVAAQTPDFEAADSGLPDVNGDKKKKKKSASDKQTGGKFLKKKDKNADEKAKEKKRKEADEAKEEESSFLKRELKFKSLKEFGLCIGIEQCSEQLNEMTFTFQTNGQVFWNEYRALRSKYRVDIHRTKKIIESIEFLKKQIKQFQATGKMILGGSGVANKIRKNVKGQVKGLRDRQQEVFSEIKQIAIKLTLLEKRTLATQEHAEKAKVNVQQLPEILHSAQALNRKGTKLTKEMASSVERSSKHTWQMYQDLGRLSQDQIQDTSAVSDKLLMNAHNHAAAVRMRIASHKTTLVNIAHATTLGLRNSLMADVAKGAAKEAQLNNKDVKKAVDYIVGKLKKLVLKLLEEYMVEHVRLEKEAQMAKETIDAVVAKKNEAKREALNSQVLNTISSESMMMEEVPAKQMHSCRCRKYKHRQASSSMGEIYALEKEINDLGNEDHALVCSCSSKA